MAYDNKRMKTLRWLEDIAKKNKSYCSSYRTLTEIFVYCGLLYATNHVVLARVDYQEFEHLSDWKWSKVDRYCDDMALLLKYPDISELDEQFANNDKFDKFFEHKPALFDCKINPKVLKDAMKGFEINGIMPIMYTSENMIFLMGHNKDVSIKTVMMGTR